MDRKYLEKVLQDGIDSESDVVKVDIEEFASLLDFYQRYRWHKIEEGPPELNHEGNLRTVHKVNSTLWYGNNHYNEANINKRRYDESNKTPWDSASNLVAWKYEELFNPNIEY